MHVWHCVQLGRQPHRREAIAGALAHVPQLTSLENVSMSRVRVCLKESVLALVASRFVCGVVRRVRTWWYLCVWRKLAIRGVCLMIGAPQFVSLALLTSYSLHPCSLRQCTLSQLL